jgi:2-polyprenyl-6-methoxyphenol hydroxylase-like FAD-dependent oxidoreductase
VIVGGGPVGSATARLLTDQDERVRILTRRGGGPDHSAIERIAVDATDESELARLTEVAAAPYNCANPPYHRWPTEWPPLS